MKKRVCWSVLVLLIVLGACTLGPSPLISPSVSPLSPVVTPEAEAQKISCSPANASSAAVFGTLQLSSPRGEPSSGSLIYLAQYVGLDSTNPIVVLDSTKDVHTVTNESGFFCFNEVSPATYGLIVWNMIESYLVTNPNDDYSLIIEATAGKSIDLGTIYTPFP